MDTGKLPDTSRRSSQMAPNGAVSPRIDAHSRSNDARLAEAKTKSSAPLRLPKVLKLKSTEEQFKDLEKRYTSALSS